MLYTHVDNQNNNRWQLEWFVCKVTWEEQTNGGALCMWVCMWHARVVSGQTGRNGGTHTHTQRLTRLIGTCRTGMREECQLTWPPSRVRGQQPSLLCQQQRSGERQPAGLQASTPTEWLTVKLSQSPWIPQWCVTHFCLPERLQSGILSYICSMRSWFKYLVCWLASWQMWHSLKFKRIILPKM